MELNKRGQISDYNPIEGIEPELIKGRDFFAVMQAIGLKESFDYEGFLKTGTYKTFTVFAANSRVTITLLKVSPELVIALCKHLEMTDECQLECVWCEEWLTEAEFNRGELCSECEQVINEGRQAFGVEPLFPEPQPVEPPRKRQRRGKVARAVEQQLNELEFTFAIVNGRPVIKSKSADN
jgi:hypothetical protein